MAHMTYIVFDQVPEPPARQITFVWTPDGLSPRKGLRHVECVESPKNGNRADAAYTLFAYDENRVYKGRFPLVYQSEWDALEAAEKWLKGELQAAPAPLPPPSLTS